MCCRLLVHRRIPQRTEMDEGAEDMYVFVAEDVLSSAH